MRWCNTAIVLLILMFGISYLQARPSLPPESGSIYGHIYDEAGEILIGATLRLSGARDFEQETQTDVWGAYRYDDLAPGRYRIQVLHEGYKTQTFDIVVDVFSLQVSRDIYMDFAPLMLTAVGCGGAITRENSFLFQE